MKRLLVSTLALGLAVVTGVASAQTYGQPDYGYDGYPRTGNVYPDRNGNDRHAQYDYARVVRVDPVIDSRYGQSNPRGSYVNERGQRCYENRSNGYDDGYQASYPDTGYYGDYREPRQDGYYDRNGDYRRNSGGTETGRNVATIVGGIAGAVLGSKVGGGSGSYATAAIGSMVGGMAGRSIYNQSQRPRNRVGTVVSCDSYPDRNSNYYRTGGYDNGDYATGGSGVSAYDVTYEYAGRRYTTRTAYHPGDRIRVRVDVRPE